MFDPSYGPFTFRYRHLSAKALNMIQWLAKVQPWDLEEHRDQDCKYLVETVERLKRCCFRLKIKSVTPISNLNEKCFTAFMLYFDPTDVSKVELTMGFGNESMAS